MGKWRLGFHSVSLFIFSLVVFFTTGCAHLHHVQIGEIAANEGTLIPFEIQVSETGVNLKEAASIARLAAGWKSAQGKAFSKVESIISLFQFGPKTGNPVYSETYADEISQLLYVKCPSKKITGLSSFRETMKYPVVSGEIVKIKGYCITDSKSKV